MSTNGKQKTILLVEDDALTAWSETTRLREYGYNVIYVLDGEKAIETIKDKKAVIDLILMDINLGEAIDGTEIAQTILKENKIPLLFFSNHTDHETVNKTENVSSYGYVVKNSGFIVLNASIKLAFKLNEAYQNLEEQKKEIESQKQELQIFEKRYRRLFESAKDGILILNADNGMIVDVNPYLIEMLGYSKDQFLKKNIWDISAFRNIDYSKKLYEELQDKEYVRYEDLPLETSTGALIHVEFVSNVYLVDGERVIQCNIRDISNRRKHEKTLTDDINKKELILREIQHRAKNSFNLITSLINLRSGVTISKETNKILQELILRVKSVSDLYSLLNETDSFFEVPLKAYCNKVIESTINLSKKVTLIKHIEEINVPTKNAAVVGMILVELLTNVIKYAFPDSRNGLVNIVLKSENANIVLIVEDNGVGLKKDFDITKVPSLGITLVKVMVEQLEGKINFISGKGTKIVIEFPL